MLEFLGSIEMVDVVMNLILGLVILAIVVSVFRAHKMNGSSRYNKFNLMDLFTSREGYVDRPALQETVAFLVMTWGFITLAVKGQLTEWYAGLYIGTFVVRAAHADWMRCKDHGPHPRPGEVVTSTMEASKTVTVEAKT